MEKEDIISESFFNSYKSFIDYLMLVSNISNEYKILVSKDIINNNLTKINVTISKNDLIRDYDNSISFSNWVVLSHEKAKKLVNKIREDFRENHHIIYSCVNTTQHTQTIQNNRFALWFKLDSDDELEEALEYNKKTNCNKIRRKELMKN